LLPCHGPQGQGLVGSNLTDDYWIHGPEFKDSLRTISDGVPDKGMIAWKESMQPNEIYAVASYIYTLRGTNPPNPKLPENEITTPAVDSSMFE
jgi:cytochrome c oxidase cbb3-type subunit 3